MGRGHKEEAHYIGVSVDRMNLSWDWEYGRALNLPDSLPQRWLASARSLQPTVLAARSTLKRQPSHNTTPCIHQHGIEQGDGSSRPAERQAGRETHRQTLLGAYIRHLYSSITSGSDSIRSVPGRGSGPFHRNLGLHRQVQEASHGRGHCHRPLLQNILLRRQADQQAPVDERTTAAAAAAFVS